MTYICEIKATLPTVKGVTFRPLEINDYEKGFIVVQDEFRESKLNKEQFIEIFNEMVCFSSSFHFNSYLKHYNVN